MHAVVVRVSISGEPNTTALRERVVPRVKQMPGLVAGYWTRGSGEGLSMIVFESEEHAKAAGDEVPSILPDNVTLESLEVREVVASA